MRISVLILTKGFRFIYKIIESLIRQNYLDVEIIIIRNDIGNLRKEYIERIVYYGSVPVREVLIKKEGKGNSLNVGIRISNDELICVLDADYLLDDNAFKIAVEHFKDYKVVTVGGSLKVMNESGKLLERLQRYENISTFQVTRRILASINGQCLISGAFGLFSKSYLL